MSASDTLNLLARARRAPLLKIAALAVASLFVLAPVHAQDEPPGRVARVSYAYGNIGFADAGTNNWGTLTPNRPISTGDSLQVPFAGKAELHVGPNALRMQENTLLSFSLLDDDNTQIDLNQGSIVIRVRALNNRENFDIRTPNLVFSLQEPGEYRINVNDDNTTTVQVRRGTAIAHGERDTITIRQGEQTRFSGSNLQHMSIGNVSPLDAFDLWAADRDRAEENVETVRYVSREVIGYEQLDQYGAWETTTDYGAVWYPRQVSASWAPYRDGNWVWVAPWGWTWVDRAPWGFAPYHYGRWAYVGTRWAWVPGPRQHHIRPVYAPALVVFVGGSYLAKPGGHQNQASVAWFPLGPGEVYRPGYTHNTQYIQRLNQSLVVNNTLVSGRYVNQGIQHAVTVVPTTTFVRGEHVMPVSSSRLFTPIKQNSLVATEAPNLTPVNNNRFGETRPRNGGEADQYRQRNLNMPAARGDQRPAVISNINEGRPVSRPAEVNANTAPGIRPNNAAVGLQNSNSFTNTPNTPITPNTSNQGSNVYTPRTPANLAPQTGNSAGINIAPAVNAPAHTPVNGITPAPNQIRPTERIENNDRSARPGNTWNNEAGNNQPRSYGNGMPNTGNAPLNMNNQRPIQNQPANTINVAPVANPPVNQQLHTPTGNTPANNAIMAPSNTNQYRPVENVDRSARPANSWNNNGQPEMRERQPERNIERGNDRPLERRPTVNAVERPVPQAPLIQPAPQAQPMPQPARMESRPAPMPMPASAPTPAPRAMPAPAPAPAEKAKDKEDPRNPKKNGNNER
ncbi:DUF6600 domain-containing protein [Undibacterium sp. JH2W]|uniref:DUF6600 domain-containing protein n=1 Tax=Undibacterium sp. JH2W TaxID=3413037 RepID=UPI003BF0D933